MVSDSSQDLVTTEIHLEGSIGDWDADNQHDHVVVDFSNENVGFGKTGTQVNELKQRHKNVFGVNCFYCISLYMSPVS